MSDAAEFRAHGSGPGADPRGWVSWGTVDADNAQQRSVRYVDDDEGHPLPVAPLVSVTLQPSGISVTCRVGASVAGAGEAEWVPFLEHDEVLVVVPEGDEKAAPCIIARTNNELDAFPRVVAGMDTTKNNFAFRRLRCSYAVEVEGGYLIRSSSTTAQLALDPAGQVFLNDGVGNRVYMSADVVGIELKDQTAFVQLDVAKKQLLLGGGTGTTLVLDEHVSGILTSGTFSIGTSGVGATGHAVTVEQMIAFVSNVIVLLNAGTAFSSTFTPAFTGGFPVTLTAIVGAAATALASPTPILAAVPGGDMTALALQPVINAALAAQGPDPQGITSGSPQFRPGLGRAGLLL